MIGIAHFVACIYDGHCFTISLKHVSKYSNNLCSLYRSECFKILLKLIAEVLLSWVDGILLIEAISEDCNVDVVLHHLIFI